MPKDDMDFTEVQVMKFSWHERKNDPSDFIGVISHETAIKKTWENPFHIFYRDALIYLYIVNLLFRMEYD